MSALASFLLADAWPLLLLVPLVAAVFTVLERRRARRLGELLGARAPVLAAGWHPGRRLALAGVFAVGLFLALLAVLQPAWGDGGDPAERGSVDVVVALDVSRSMLARDLEPDRLSLAKAQIRELAEHAEGDRMALVVFAGDALLFVPLTKDRRSLAEMTELADPLAVPTGGTDLGEAIRVSLDALDGGGAILLLTDGGDHEGRGLEATEAVRQRGISIHAVGYGSERGAKIPVTGETGESYLKDREGREVVTRMDRSSLVRLAAATGGGFTDASATEGSLRDVYEHSIRPLAEQTIEAEKEKKRQNRYQWPLAAALILWTIGLWANERRS